MRKILQSLLAVALVVAAGVGTYAYATTQFPSPSRWLQIMSSRGGEKILTFGGSPSADATLGGFIADHNYTVRNIQLGVGRVPLGTGGSTSAYLMKNGVTVASSTVTVAASAGDGARGVTGLSTALVPGDILTVQIGAVCTATACQQVVAQVRLAEEF